MQVCPPIVCFSPVSQFHSIKVREVDFRVLQVQYSRIRAAPLRVDCSQVYALGHKDVELSELLHIVDGEMDVSPNLHIPEVAAVHGHHATTQLGVNKNMFVCILKDEANVACFVLFPGMRMTFQILRYDSLINSN